MNGRPHRFVYWAAACMDDHRVYNIREATRRAAVAERTKRVGAGNQYGPVTKVEVYYRTRLDFVNALLGEGGAESLLPRDEEKDD